MTVKASESVAMARKRQVTEMSTGPTWKAVTYALGGLMVVAVGLAFWLGETLGMFGEAIKNNAEGINRNAAGIERLERGQERLEDLLFEILREMKGDE